MVATFTDSVNCTCDLIHTHPNSYLYFILQLNTGTVDLFLKELGNITVLPWMSVFDSILTPKDCINNTYHILQLHSKQQYM